VGVVACKVLLEQRNQVTDELKEISTVISVIIDWISFLTSLGLLICVVNVLQPSAIKGKS